MSISIGLHAIGRTLELGEGVHWVLDLLLGALAHLGPDLFGLLRAHQWFFLGRFHFPDDDR